MTIFSSVQKHFTKTYLCVCAIFSMSIQLPCLATSDARDDDPQVVSGLSAIFGVDAGPVWVSSGHPDFEASKNGIALSGKALLSFYVQRFIFEGGPGWSSATVKGGPAKALLANGDSDSKEVNTQFGYGEFSFRYRPTRVLQLGLISQVTAGSDATFSPFRDGNKRPQALGGVVIAHGDPQKVMDMRIGLQFLTDLSVSDRQIYLLQASVHFGVPLFRGDTIVKDKIVKVTKEQTVIKHVNRLLVTLEPDVVSFQPHGAALTLNGRHFLDELGRYLMQHQEDWGEIDIAAHTDEGDSAEERLKLSEDRAAEVKAVFAAVAIPTEKIRTYGFGDKRPGPHKRRIELSFAHVKKAKEIADVITQLKQNLKKPLTCQEDVCQ